MGVGRLLAIGVTVALLFASTAFADVNYRAEITGVEDSDLASLLDKVSELKTLEDKPPVSEEALRRRADRDLDRLADAAHSLGYWDAEFSYDLDTETEPAKVTVKVDPGPLYHVGSVEVLRPNGQKLSIPGEPKLPLNSGDPARTAPVVATEAALVSAFGDNGYPFAKVVDRRVEIDRDAKRMDVTYTLDPGPTQRFGPVAITGLEQLNPAYVEGRIRWQLGAVYDASKVEETRRALLESGLFSTVQITPTPNPDNPEEVRMTVEATERVRHTVGAGLAYNTSQGFGARAVWEDRNLFGNAENLRLSAEVGQQLDDFRVNFRRPDFLTVDQDFLATAEAANDTPVAYRSRRVIATAGIERRIDRWLTGGLSLEGEQANVTQLANVTPRTGTQSYQLAGLPAYLKLDETDNLLNPTTGYRAQLNITPAHTFSGSHLTFSTNLVSGSTYWAILPDERAVLAGKLALGSLDGAPLSQLPSDQRIYAGGGGSVRPYGYLMAGPLASNNVPIGGRSSLVLNLESRIKITETIGVVPFLDAGSYYESPLPQPGHTPLYGVGLGLRYYTAFGPLRLDLATPLRKRSGDSPIQVYISLGQAF
ncbi:MAG: outer membrane protein assembly factor [Alphaproteobacteria bacterium]|nr:outer membrane protein assembly factor [Alphaproteobacteria bacterium]